MMKYKDEDVKKKDDKVDKEKNKCNIKTIKKLADEYDDLECTKDILFEASETQLDNSIKNFESMMEVLNLENELGEKINLWFKECSCKYPTSCRCKKVSKKFSKVKEEEAEIFEAILKAFCELIKLFEEAEEIDEAKNELLNEMKYQCIPEKK